jgi:hypothetical protein
MASAAFRSRRELMEILFALYGGLPWLRHFELHHDHPAAKVARPEARKLFPAWRRIHAQAVMP